MKTLIVYELIPESTQIYLVDGDKRNLHNKFINYTEEDEMTDAEVEELTNQNDWGEPIYNDEQPGAIKLPKTDELYIVVCGMVI